MNGLPFCAGFVGVFLVVPVLAQGNRKLNERIESPEIGVQACQPR